MPPKGYTETIFTPIKSIKIFARTGTKVHIEKPVDITYDIKCPDQILAVGKAINQARHTYVNLDWSNIIYTSINYMYPEAIAET